MCDLRPHMICTHPKVLLASLVLVAVRLCGLWLSGPPVRVSIAAAPCAAPQHCTACSSRRAASICFGQHRFFVNMSKLQLSRERTLARLQREWTDLGVPDRFESASLQELVAFSELNHRRRGEDLQQERRATSTPPAAVTLAAGSLSRYLTHISLAHLVLSLAARGFSPEAVPRGPRPGRTAGLLVWHRDERGARWMACASHLPHMCPH